MRVAIEDAITAIDESNEALTATLTGAVQRGGELIAENEALRAQLAEATRSLEEADRMIRHADQQLASAGERVGCYFGSDTADHMADRIRELEGCLLAEQEHTEYLQTQLAEREAQRGEALPNLLEFLPARQVLEEEK